jgi:hypothetical protein
MNKGLIDVCNLVVLLKRIMEHWYCSAEGKPKASPSVAAAKYSFGCVLPSGAKRAFLFHLLKGFPSGGTAKQPKGTPLVAFLQMQSFKSNGYLGKWFSISLS